MNKLKLFMTLSKKWKGKRFKTQVNFFEGVQCFLSRTVFSLLVASGQGIFTYAGYLSEYKSNDAPFIIALIGRLIYGLGSESLIVCQYTLVSKWFIDSQISFALSIILCISWLGNWLTGYIIPPIADKTSLGFALNIGAITAFISLILVMFLIAFDIYADKKDKANGYQKIEENDKFQCKDIKELGLIYWITVFNWLCWYTGLMFNTFSNDFFKVRYGFDQVEAGRLCSNAWLVSIAFIPLFGYISDRFGHRITFLIFATSTLTLSNILFILIPSSTSENKSYYGLIPVWMNGIASSVYASVLFPTTPMLVKPHVLGTAYGLFSSCVWIGLAVGPIIVGFLTFNSKNECTYDWVNVSMAWFCMIGVIFSIFLLFLNKLWLNNLLQKPSKYIQIESQQRLQTKNSEISSND